MATARSSADFKAAPSAVYAVVADPARLPEWDVSYSETRVLPSEPGHQLHFVAHRLLANREMRLVCRVEQADPPAHFAFVCEGDAGEQVRADITLAANGDGAGTRMTILSEFDLGHADPSADPLSVVPELTYTQAWLDRSVEQAFAHLGALVGAAEERARRA